MFTLPIFVYSKKTVDVYYLNNISINADIPAGYNWNTSTVTIGGSTVSNPYYIDVRNGVEIVTKNGTKYIKVIDYYLTEEFDNTTNLNTTENIDPSSEGYVRALWANSTTAVDSTTAQGVAGRLECAYSIETAALSATSSDVANANALVFLKSTTSKTSNTSVTEAGDTPANKIILGKSILDTETTAYGNTLFGTSSYNNNPIYYPFFNKPTNTASASYGANDNIVPSGATITKITFTSTSAGVYSLAGKLVLGFDLYNGSTLINSNVQVELLAATDLAYSTINSFVTVNNLFSQNITLRNVRLKNVNSGAGQTFETAPFATSIYTALTLSVEATYTSPSSDLVTTQPEITSDPFILKTSVGTEFVGFGSVTLYEVNSENGIEVRARFSETLEGLQSVAYTLLGTATGTGTETITLDLSNDDQNPLFEAAKKAKYIQLNFKGKINPITTIYNQSSLKRVAVVTQLDPRKRSFKNNAFPDRLKFSTGGSKTIVDGVFGPFILKNEGPERLYSTENKATYGKFGYKYGVIKLEHLKHTSLTYYAKNTLNSDTSTQPTYIPTDDAITAFNARVPTSGRTKHLVLKYDVVVVQGDDRNPDITRYGSSTFTSNVNTYLQNFFGSPGLETNITNPKEIKSVYLTAQKVGLTNNQLPDQIERLRNTATFSIPKTISYVDTERVCSTRTSLTQSCLRLETDYCASCCDSGSTPIRFVAGGASSTSSFDSCTAQCCQKTYCAEYGYQEREYCEDVTISKKVNNIFFTFGFVNFKEVVVEYDPVRKVTAEVWSKAYDINNNVNAQEVIGLWVGSSSTTVNYLEPVFSVTDAPVSFTPEKIIVPAFNFDFYSNNSLAVQKPFTAKMLVEFLDNTDTPINGATISKTFTGSSTTETIFEAPTNISNAKKIRTYLGITPTGLTEYETGTTSTAATKLGISPTRYIINGIEDYNDVGLDFASKMRIEYTDTSVTVSQRKKYKKSRAISNAYDLFTISGVSYTIDVDNYPTIKGNVLLEGTASIPEGTSVTVEWQGSADSTTWSSWTTDTSSADLKKRYLRFRVTLLPENQTTGLGYKSPILDQIKLKFWPYNTPHIEKHALSLTGTGAQAVISQLSFGETTVTGTDIEYKISTNNGTNYTTLTEPLLVTTVSSASTNAKLRVNFLTDLAELNKVAVDIFSATPVTTTTTTSTTTTTTV